MALTCEDGTQVAVGGVMSRGGALHSVDELLLPAFEASVSAVDPPKSDDALVALGRVLAGTLDRMSNAERAVMLGQTAPQLLRVLVELDRRDSRRRRPDVGPPNALDRLRAAHRRGLKGA